MTIKDDNHRAAHQYYWFKGELFQGLIWDVGHWAEARNITAGGGATALSQADKLKEEVQEFIDAATDQEAKLEFGDMFVVLLNIARLRGLDMVECLELAYDKIKDRKGTMVAGKFVKAEG